MLKFFQQSIRPHVRLKSPRKLKEPKETPPVPISLDYDQFSSILYELIIRENVETLITTLDCVVVEAFGDDLIDLWQYLHQIRKLAYAHKNARLEEVVTRFEETMLR